MSENQETTEKLRVCKKCNNVFPLTSFPIIYKKYNGKDYKTYRHSCPKCYYQTRSDYYKKRYRKKKLERARTVSMD